MTRMINATMLRAGLRAAVVVGVAGLLAVPAAQAQQKQQQRGPLVLKSASYFYVGGNIDTKAKGSPIVGHMYVEYMIPQQVRSPYPIVMVHGGNQTGTNFTGTPDGREGWAQYFVRRGYAVYIVDQVARGRSAHWNEYYGAVQPSRLNQVEERFVAPERFPVWPQAKLHTQWPGTGKPGDAAFDQFYAAQAVSVASFAKQQEINPPALIALMEKIGPSILMIHSQSGAFAWPVADRRPDLVKMIVAVEPNGPPVRELQMVGAPDWFKDGITDKLLRAGRGAADLRSAARQRRAAVVRAAGEGRRARPRALLAAEGAGAQAQEPCQRPGGGGDERGVLSRAVRSLHRRLPEAGQVATDFIRLADVGIRGNGHMMMLEKNSDDIARVMDEWIVQRLNTVRDAAKGKKK